VFGEETGCASERAAIQSLSRARRRRASRHCRRLGFRAMDGESALLSAHRRARRLLVPRSRESAALPLRGHHWRNLRFAFPTRRSRLWIERRLGSCLRHLLVVPGAAHPQVAPGRAKTGLVARARPGTLRPAHRSHRLWFDRRIIYAALDKLWV